MNKKERDNKLNPTKWTEQVIGFKIRTQRGYEEEKEKERRKTSVLQPFKDTTFLYDQVFLLLSKSNTFQFFFIFFINPLKEQSLGHPSFPSFYPHRSYIFFNRRKFFSLCLIFLEK